MRCRALDNTGRQCRGLAVGEYSYHGDSELDLAVGWVLVPFCKKHVGAMNEEETHQQTTARYRRERIAATRRNNAEKEREGGSARPTRRAQS